MPSIDTLTDSDIDTINKIKNRQLPGIGVRSSAYINIPGHTVIPLDTSKNPNLYIKKETEKKKIVLHGTVGYLLSDIISLTSQTQMTAHYVIARDGTIIEIYPPVYWSFHLGKNCKGGNGYISQESISIEISNYGILELKNLGDKSNPNDDKFYTVYGNLYCNGYERMDENGRLGGTFPTVTKLINPYRGYQYYATITESQYRAVNSLINTLCNKFAIPMTAIEYVDRFKVFKSDDDARNYQGICSHVNFRDVGKWDLAAWCDWDKILNTQDNVEWVESSDAEGVRELKEEKFDGKNDNWEYKDTIDPITGEVIELSEKKKQRILMDNNPLICAL